LHVVVSRNGDRVLKGMSGCRPDRAGHQLVDVTNSGLL